MKHSGVSDFTMEAKYVAASKAVKEIVWLRNVLRDLKVIPDLEQPMVVYCDNSGAVANNKEPRIHQRGKHIDRKFHLIRDIVERGDVTVCKIKSEDNLSDPFTKTLSSRVFEGHLKGLGIRVMSRFL